MSPSSQALDLVIFGGDGDLAMRKLLPPLFMGPMSLQRLWERSRQVVKSTRNAKVELRHCNMSGAGSPGDPHMFRTLLKSKIHRVAVTHCVLHYEGSCAIDENLLEAAGIVQNEQIHVWNIDNGERFVTYAIKGQRGTGIISVNGSAARRAAVGDLIIIAAFAQVHEDQVSAHAPKLVFVDEANRQVGERDFVPVQLDLRPSA